MASRSVASDPSNEATATPRSAAVSFGAGSYSVDEGGTVAVTVQLDAAPGREVTVPVSAAGAGGATPPGETGADWSGVPESVTFGATDTEQTFTLAATDDTDVDAGESVALSFGTLPAGVTAGTPSEATVTIVDNDVLPTLGVANMAGLESDGVTFTVTLSAAATGRDGDLDGVDRDRRHGGGGGSRVDDGDGDRRGDPDDGDVHGADGRGPGGHHRRGRRDLHADAVEPVGERDAGVGRDRDGHDHRRRRSADHQRRGPDRDRGRPGSGQFGGNRLPVPGDAVGGQREAGAVQGPAGGTGQRHGDGCGPEPGSSFRWKRINLTWVADVDYTEAYHPQRRPRRARRDLHAGDLRLRERDGGRQDAARPSPFRTTTIRRR